MGFDAEVSPLLAPMSCSQGMIAMGKLHLSALSHAPTSPSFSPLSLHSLRPCWLNLAASLLPSPSSSTDCAPTMGLCFGHDAQTEKTLSQCQTFGGSFGRARPSRNPDTVIEQLVRRILCYYLPGQESRISNNSKASGLDISSIMRWRNLWEKFVMRDSGLPVNLWTVGWTMYATRALRCIVLEISPATRSEGLGLGCVLKLGPSGHDA